MIKYLILAVIATLFLINLLKNYYRTNFKWSLKKADKMTGEQFERYVAKAYKCLGYKCYLTKKSGDQGIDLIVKKSFIKTGIQIKRYKKTVGNKAVQEAVAGKSYYKLNQVAVITTSTYSASAKELAKANNVELLDRKDLEDIFNSLIKKCK